MPDIDANAHFYRLLVIEDDPVIRQSLIEQIEQSDTLILVGQADSVDEAISLLSFLPDLVILDIGLIDGSGLDVLRYAQQTPEYSEIRFLIHSMFGDEKHVIDAMTLGASGYLLKDAGTEGMTEKIHDTLRGNTPMSASAAAHLLKRFRALQPPVQLAPQVAAEAGVDGYGLTSRETETLQLLAKGLSYRLTAQALEISTHTVADYVKQIYRKLNVNSRSEAVYEAINAGVIKL